MVIDAGSRFGPPAKALFQQGVTVYLVMQVSISELRNSNRLITDLFKVTGVDLEIVLNRFTLSSLGIDENGINKALTMPAKWKIPSDYPAVSTRTEYSSSASAQRFTHFESDPANGWNG